MEVNIKLDLHIQCISKDSDNIKNIFNFYLYIFQIQDATCASSEPYQRMVYMKTADGYAWRDMPAGKGYARSLRCMINMES